MLKTFAIIFGAIFILVGALGFIPTAAPDGHLLGIFHVNPAHNIVHLLTGAVALICGLSSSHASQLFFRIFGIIYGGVAVLGFIMGDQPLLGIIANNHADAWLHAGIAVVSLALGFVFRETAAAVGDH